MELNPLDFADCRSRWLAGECPCCGGEICEHYDGTQPEPLGEGVMICGRCIANEHMADRSSAAQCSVRFFPARR